MVPSHKGQVLSLKWSTDGTYLASGDDLGVIQIWDKIPPRVVLQPTTHSTPSMRSVDLGAGGGFSWPGTTLPAPDLGLSTQGHSKHASSTSIYSVHPPTCIDRLSHHHVHPPEQFDDKMAEDQARQSPKSVERPVMVTLISLCFHL